MTRTYTENAGKNYKLVFYLRWNSNTRNYSLETQLIFSGGSTKKKIGQWKERNLDRSEIERCADKHVDRARDVVKDRKGTAQFPEDIGFGGGPQNR